MKPEIRQRIEQINNGIVPDGYKKTEFGVFPCDWESKRIEDIAILLGGGTPNTQTADFWTGNIPWISSSDVFDDSTTRISSNRHITKDAVENSATKIIPPNSILIVSRVGVGKLAINKNEVCTSQDFTNLTKIKEDVNYTAFALKNHIAFEMSKVQGTSIKGISSKEIKKYTLQFPVIEEQEKIAEILMKWDEAIELQEKYIEKLKLKRKSLLQKVFPTDKSNTTIKLGDYLIQCTNRNKTNIDNVKSVSNIRGFIDQKDQFSKEVASEDLSNYKVVKKGNIAYNPSRINVGSIAIYEDENPGIVSPMYVVFSCNGISPKYLLLLLESCRGKYEIKSYLSGSVRDSLSFEDLCDISLPIPAMVQEIIVCVFEEIEKVISHNNDLLQKMIDQRKALQQYLLSGIVRVNHNVSQ